ncbi:HD domain-containing phosphohydrolase [Aeromonas veronii]|uniref:HD domain-containing phosphohydrolase n=1 Tax=Aeromonas veronii TaxID=654 RepID=UPI0011176EB4|nr:HD domain-containing phosphohydrolase [Aeromonas veronii]TNI95673.1 phosphodiesterase [Aeromonas veronii]
MDSTFNERIQNVHSTLRKHFDKLSRISVAVYDQYTGNLKTFAHSTEGSSPLSQYEIKLNDVPSLHHLAKNKQIRVINNLNTLSDSKSVHCREILGAGYESSFTTPILFNGRLFGFLFCNSKEPFYFNKLIRNELSVYAESLAAIIAIEFSSIQTLCGALITAREFSRYRDEETANHLRRMSLYSRLIAKYLAPTHGLSDEEVEYIYMFSELHDIGKIAIPDAVLLKPGKLTIEEFNIMKTHPVKGEEMITLMINEFGLDGIHHIDMLKNIIMYHHERFDGMGYPEGLKEMQIPLPARIVTVADVFDALTSSRPYKKAWSFDAAFDYLEEYAGSQFDPACVKAAIDQKSEFLVIRNKYLDSER